MIQQAGVIDKIKFKKKLYGSLFVIVLFVILFTWLLSGCKSHTENISQYSELFPIFKKYKVTAFRNQDWCKNIVYNRGAFSNSKMSTCNLFDELPFSFDEAAQRDFNILVSAIQEHNINLKYFNARYLSDGNLSYASFKEDKYEYVYKPGYNSLPEGVSKEMVFEKINHDWYMVSSDWN